MKLRYLFLLILPFAISACTNYQNPNSMADTNVFVDRVVNDYTSPDRNLNAGYAL